MEKLAFYGAGGHGFAALELARSTGLFDPAVFYDDRPKQPSILGIDVLPTPRNIPFKNLCISIGNNQQRKAVSEKWRLNAPILVHPSATLYNSAEIGKGTLIFPQVVIDAQVRMGNYCIINNHATLSHNVILGDFVHIAINAAVCGGVDIGEGSLIGAGAVILPDIKIGKWAVVGAGAVVTKDVPDHARVMGNPAKQKST